MLTPTFKLEYNQKNITKDVSDYVVSIDYADYEHTELKDFGYFSGKYHITEAHHRIDKTMGYSTSLEVKSC